MQFRLVFVLACLLALSGFSLVSAQSPDPLIPGSGTWEVVLVDIQNNCPADITLEDAWMPASGTQHALSFSTLDRIPFDLHTLVAEEILDEPEAFQITRGDYNQYEIVPAIQTAPYLYRYAVLDEGYIVLEYTQTLALSDCVMVATYNVALVSGAGTKIDPAPATTTVSLHNWTLFGDGDALSHIDDDPSAPDGALCAVDQSRGETWFFVADEAFVNQVSAGYGKTLSYDIRITQGNINQTFVDYDIELVVGNGIILHYYFDYTPTDEWTRFEVRLDETAGWIDPDGSIPTDDPAIFPEIVRNITQVLIRGEYISGSDTACIANVRVGDNQAVSPVDDQTGAIAALVTPETGLYEAVVSDLAGNCPSNIAVGMRQQGLIEFSALRQGTILVMLDDTVNEPVILFIGEAHGVYVMDGPPPSVLSVISKSAFTLEHTFGQCIALFDVARVD